MKIERPRNTFPYSLHDSHIRKIKVKKNKIVFHFSHIYLYENETETTCKASIIFPNADLDFCSIQVLKSGKKDRIKGKEYSLKKFAEKFPKVDLEVVTDCYNGYHTIWTGYFYKGKKWYQFHINLWNASPIQYEIKE